MIWVLTASHWLEYKHLSPHCSHVRNSNTANCRAREQWQWSFTSSWSMQCEIEQLECNSHTPVSLKMWGETLVKTSRNRLLLWQGKVPGSSKVSIGSGPLPALLGPGVWELLSCPYRALSWPNPLLPAGERRKDDWRWALCGGLWSLCNNSCGKPHLLTAQPFSFLSRKKKKSPFSEDVDECSSRQLKTATQQWLSYPILSFMVPYTFFLKYWIIRTVAVPYS